eukprot:TRINITY_DN178_c0_g3_i2.p2 TRINITY_DN178_c0_g3~~TRINITY_DN178_c0_g3_i2.p2  ORF type:complete len:393 (-),score=125.21 TRINITY_DN178_c0_g3_i2:1630-2808(-)
MASSSSPSPSARAHAPHKRAWRQRPVFMCQLQLMMGVVLLSPLLLLSHMPPRTFLSPVPPNPCAPYATPPPLPRNEPPPVFFLHVPKTAGTLVYKMLLRYANRTHGLSCTYRFDGNRHAFSHFSVVNAPPPQSFANHSLSAQLLRAERARARAHSGSLLARGACRVLRGHVTTDVLSRFERAPLSLTVLREPLARFVSMYEFARSMARARPGVTGWDDWLRAPSLAAELANSSSLFHRGFYDAAGQWRAHRNEGFSFHFYGVLHQLSGLTPRFVGERDPFHFDMANGAEMAEKAKQRLCAMHIVGLQPRVSDALAQFLALTQRFARWSRAEKRALMRAVLNKTPARVSRNVDDHLPRRMKRELQRRLRYESDVYQFAQRLVRYRAAVRHRRR